MSAVISQLVSYPIKSCAGVSHPTIELNTLGLKADRQLMLVNENGLFLSQRKHPRMALIQPHLTPHCLTVNAPGMAELIVDLKAAIQQPVKVTIWQDALLADSLHPDANRWFSDFLGLPVNLVKYQHESQRYIDSDYAKHGETVAFADGFPLLITHEASLEQLNQYLNTDVTMNRFRPNIVIKSELQAWDELQWQSLSGQGFRLDSVKPCSRCVITGVEQSTGTQTGTEVLLALKNKFPHNKQAVFGINAIVNITGHQAIELAVGQSLEIEHQAPNN